MISFTEGQKQVDVFPAAGPDRPVLYLHTFGQEGREVWNQLKASGCPDFTLAAVSGLDWNHDMVPWDAPALSDTDAPFTGGADAWLRLLTDRILSQAEAAGLRHGGALPAIPWPGCSPCTLPGTPTPFPVPPASPVLSGSPAFGSIFFPGHRPLPSPVSFFLWETGSAGPGTRT